MGDKETLTKKEKIGKSSRNRRKIGKSFTTSITKDMYPELE